MKRCNIFIDEEIAFSEAFEVLGNVIKVRGRSITNCDLKECDVLIVRSVTKVDGQLLEGNNVKFVGTVTSGIDHIDLEYLVKNNIYLADAKGCNSFAVAEYVITAIAKLLSNSVSSFSEVSIGIIGFGNIGSKVAKMCQALGMKIKVNDPPLQEIDTSFISTPLIETLKCDIVTLHVPLTFSGEYKTFNLLQDNLNLIKDNSILINTSRGGVVDENKLLEIITKRRIRSVTDVWVNEPEINLTLLQLSDISTPHIAGYSAEGKINATKMVFEKLNKFLNTNHKFDFDSYNQQREILRFDDEFTPSSFNNFLQKIYQIEKDSLLLKEMITLDDQKRKIYFDELRKNYKYRKSFKEFLVQTSNVKLKSILEELRFQVGLSKIR
jgi:erythronate-4-phosphate dehydrogenase